MSQTSITPSSVFVLAFLLIGMGCKTETITSKTNVEHPPLNLRMTVTVAGSHEPLPSLAVLDGLSVPPNGNVDTPIQSIYLGPKYSEFVPRIATWQKRIPLDANLFYEGNNLDMRKENDTGQRIGTRWRQIVKHTKKVFVLRDSLYSQQDPYNMILLR